MKYLYDRASDSLSIVFAEGRRYRDSEDIYDGVAIDYDTAGRPIAVDFYDRASRFVDTDGLASGREIVLEHPELPEIGPWDGIKGEWLRSRRLQLGLTQEQLARQLSVGKNTVARWEREELKIEHPGMVKLALEALERTDAIQVEPGVWQVLASARTGSRIAPQSKQVTRYSESGRFAEKKDLGSSESGRIRDKRDVGDRDIHGVKQERATKHREHHEPSTKKK